MADDLPEFSVIKAENCPKELKKRLKIRALERDVDLQDLIIEYCREGLDREAEKLFKRKPR